MMPPSSYAPSPEDGMSLWQYMTVSWLGPLIRIGSSRQLQEWDVWQLPKDFQHEGLHERFAKLKGTVIQRLIKLIFIDLIILTILGLLELVLQYSTPVLLQLLLQSVENGEASKDKAVLYASISLLARLIAAQSGVFSLWHGRRCYEQSRGGMITMLYEKTLDRKIGFAENEKTVKDANGTVKGETASMGKILNLMRNDVYEVAQRFWEIQGLVQKPLSVVISIAVTVRLLGWPSLLPVLAIILAQALIAVLARIRVYCERTRRQRTDRMLNTVSEFVESIRHLRWYGWEQKWLNMSMKSRQAELNMRIVTEIWGIAIGFVNALTLDLAPVLAFFAYTVLAGRELRIDIAFPAMQVFSMMTSALRDLPQMITVLINAYVAVGRVEDYMAEPEKQEMNTEALFGNFVAFNGASFAWPGSTTPVLQNVNLQFPEKLTVVFGEVGSGKTALLEALLGELDLLEGVLMKPNTSIGYCAQTPWLQSKSIKDNILFGAPYQEARYEAVLKACELVADLNGFKDGDFSLVGENGIGLSGGQRARIALARAIYSDANTLVLDDPLSALDKHTAALIVENCFTYWTRTLLKGRTVILVTHRLDLVMSLTRQLVEIKSGTANIVEQHAVPPDALARSASVKPLSAEEQADLEKYREQLQSERRHQIVKAKDPEKFIEDEHREHGGVKPSVYWQFVKAGQIRWWVLLLLVLTIYRLSALAEAWFLKTWAESYTDRSRVVPLSIYLYMQSIGSSLPILRDFPPPNENVRPWLLGFFVLALYQSVSFILFRCVMLIITYTTGKGMFAGIMDKVAGATFRFYDVTPVGRLMNRMTSDIGVIDGNISNQLQSVVWLSIAWISSIAVIASITPAFLVFAMCLTSAYVLIFTRFIPTSQSLRRLEVTSLSPLMSNFGSLLQGLTTVRAFRVQPQFQAHVIAVVDTFQRMDHFYWSLQAWLMYRYDCLAAISTFLITLLALYTNVSAGLLAFLLLSADKLVQSTHRLCKQYGQLQMEFVSVERVVELAHLEQEPKGCITPPAWWPSFSGEIIFNNVSVSYAPHLDPALKEISVTIQGGSKTAIIGRTGSGKSTLALALVAAVVPNTGRILIDTIDIAEIDKQLLRSKVTFVAQDPVLFPGTIALNLDPLGEYTDRSEEVQDVLKRVCGSDFEVDFQVEMGGKNLSQGQRQLVGLARAILRRSAIIILDEATASIDQSTAWKIQQVIQEELKESTVITIAHRVEAVKNADYRIELADGKVVSHGPVSQ